MNEELRTRIETAIRNADGQLGITKVSAKDLKALLVLIDELNGDAPSQQKAPRKP